MKGNSLGTRRNGLNRVLFLLLASLFVLAGTLALPTIYYLWLLQQTDVVERELEPDMLHALAIPGLIIELEREKGIRSLDSTVLELDRKDLNLLLQTGFSEQDIFRKALEAHRSIVDHARIGPRDTFTFAISISQELPVFHKNLLRILQHKMVALPECSMGEFLGIAWRRMGRLFGAKLLSPEEQLRKLPHCRPPRTVQESVMRAVEARLARSLQNAPDSVHVRPAFGPKAHRFVRRNLALGQAGPWFLPVLPLLLGLIAALSWKDRSACYARLAAPVLITGLVLLFVNVPLFYFYHHLDLFSTVHKIDPDYRMSESTGQWLQVVFYLLREVMKEAARNIAFTSAFFILAGLILVRLHQRYSLHEQQQEIDTASVSGLGSAAIPASSIPPDQDESDAASRAVL
jgi:hypothetical protein